jgi:hypothetical protein
LRPGFTALAAGRDGRAACAWLENRHRFQQPFASLVEPASAAPAAEALVYAGPDGKGVCPCCDLAAARTADGLLVAFRNSEDGYRDIWVARSAGGAKFAPPVAVTPPRWRFSGCPHDGPALAVAGDRVHVMWMDAHTEQRRVYLASATLADLRFTTRPVGPAEAGEQSHPCLTADGSGDLNAAWEEVPPAEVAGGGRAVVYARLTGPEGFAPARAIAARPGVFQTHPSLARSPTGGLFAAWHERGAAGKSIVVARLEATVRRAPDGPDSSSRTRP